MKKKFEKPVGEVINLGRDVIATSGCGCDVGGIDLGTDFVCTGPDDPKCTCRNVDGHNCW